ncbi:efflux RND transporter periplasmic adaptor subunit [Xanthovirga aplysinae]|uniref:efflux RND transporter periplasmic adaptor subunit n=1 Tax=Xanthovirga aplysinae TaxID=2529853 RepID=UPI0012BC8AA1|nr:efflux RND transporter periplasmic adaptor subunit [Xanthovirga aplysinae]MTI32474.1 efflux RND transporter periplasmic adaptor subunit [Xanthovirga aplysinae]
MVKGKKWGGFVQDSTFICVVIVFISLSLFSILFSCGTKNKRKKENLRPIKYMPVVYTAGERAQTFTGVSVAAVETELSFRVGGVLNSLEVNEGEEVRKGDLVATIDNIDDQLELETAKAVLRDMEVQRDASRANLARVKSLFEENNVSLSDYEKAKSEYANALSNFEASIKKVDIKQRQVEYGTLLSPVDGIVIEKRFVINEIVKPGEAVVVINSEDSIDVEVGVPESFISKIYKGIPVVVNFSSIEDVRFTGEVTVVPFTRQAESASYKVVIRLNQISKVLRPGMPAEVTFLLPTTEKYFLTVPAVAVNEDESGRFVYVVEIKEKNLGIVHRRAIEIGTLQVTGFEVLSGLKAGELVVVAGIPSLYEGMEVRLIE